MEPDKFGFNARRMTKTLIAIGGLLPGFALACSSCGCSISTDWATQGMGAGSGWRADFRYDYINQNQLRTGTGTVDRGSIAFPAAQETQQDTVTRTYNAFIDYSPNANWGVNAQVPYFDRNHTTVVAGDTEVSTSNTQSMGDVRVLGRYLGFADDHSWGVQMGVKLATGSYHNNFIAGPQAGNPLDRGVQPGTGTTDLLVGVFKFGSLSRDWDYFGQALLQQPMNSVENFRPGTGLNVNFGVRYMAFERFVPQLQINTRMEKRESGANADIPNSGATLVYLSPGITVNITHAVQAFSFVQVPIYQNVNGLQIEARYTVSAGVRLAF
jgi:hypothetical protein